MAHTGPEASPQGPLRPAGARTYGFNNWTAPPTPASSHFAAADFVSRVVKVMFATGSWQFWAGGFRTAGSCEETTPVAEVTPVAEEIAATPAAEVTRQS